MSDALAEPVKRIVIWINLYIELKAYFIQKSFFFFADFELGHHF